MKLKGLVFIGFVLLVILGVFGILNSSAFEKNPPSVSLPEKIYWNMKNPISVVVGDDTGIKSVKISLQDGAKVQNLAFQEFKDRPKEFSMNLEFPKSKAFRDKSEFTVILEVTDASKANFFTGNTKKVVSKIIIDTRRPEVVILNQSYKIAKGGSAAVVFRAKDDSLKEVYIETNFGKRFIATPFYKEDYYAALVAWPSKEENFSADVVAVDMAGNVNKSRIRYYLQDRKYRVSKIALTDKFLDGKITDLAEKYADDPANMEKLAKFKFVNETLRLGNEDKIGKITSRVPEKQISDFKVSPFYPLKNGAAVASFGDHRYYTYEGAEASESYHMGLDLASVAGADIVTSNPAVVVFNEENGIYGLNLILYHGFGLYSLYGHCSNLNVNVGDQLPTGTVVGTTGTTGLALGDHLHFGILVQGIEVRPEEWMDTKWMKDNVYEVLEGSKKAIDSRK